MAAPSTPTARAGEQGAEAARAAAGFEDDEPWAAVGGGARAAQLPAVAVVAAGPAVGELIRVDSGAGAPQGGLDLLSGEPAAAAARGLWDVMDPALDVEAWLEASIASGADAAAQVGGLAWGCRRADGSDLFRKIMF